MLIFIFFIIFENHLILKYSNLRWNSSNRTANSQHWWVISNVTLQLSWLWCYVRVMVS